MRTIIQRLPSQFLISALLITGVIPATSAKEQSQRIAAEKIDFDNTQNLQMQIWADRVPTLRRLGESVQHVAPSVTGGVVFFTATFNDGPSSVVLSVISDGCSRSSALPNDSFCPARLVEFNHGKIRLLKEFHDFDVYMIPGDQGYDATSNHSKTDATLVSLDLAKKQVSARTIRDGKLAAEATTYNLY